MAKSIDSAFAKLQALKNAASKFSPSVGEGNRTIPSPSKDEQISVRERAAFNGLTSRQRGAS
jgi:hypothetical protein